MKLSLSWILNHINYNDKINALELVSKFNTHSAEIESFSKVVFDKELFELVFCKLTNGYAEYLLPSQEQIILSERSLLQNGSYYLVKKSGPVGLFDWVKMSEFSKDRDGLFPAMMVSHEEFIKSSWKIYLPQEDIILDIDNKSLTNRPDMWGHRGIAREIAFLMNLELKKKELLIEGLPCQRFEENEFMANDFSLNNLAPDSCLAFSLTKFSGIKNQSTHPMIAIGLALIGEKPIDLIVDLTNYVMNDWGHPMHAFDYDLLSADATITVRQALEDETLKLLDNSSLKLSSQDLVVADNSGKALSLAGIKGGVDTGISLQTKNVLLEVANWKPDVIRKMSARQKARTNASARYEKTLDSEQIPDVVRRFAHLAKACNMSIDKISDIFFSCKIKSPTIIHVKHSFLETFSGLKFSFDRVVEILTKLEFCVSAKHYENDIDYNITVPTFRSTKNVLTREDILEEVTRCAGFENIQSIIPAVTRKPFDLAKTMKARSLKKYLAYGMQMVEQVNYVFYDEAFISQISLSPAKTIDIVNPVSENNYRLVQSLIPGLLKNTLSNKSLIEDLRFFEIAKVWPEVESGIVVEAKMIAGTIINKNKPVDFYAQKAYLEHLFQLAGVVVEWRKKEISESFQPWQSQYQSANLYLNSEKIGTAGIINKKTLLSLDFDKNAGGFYFEFLASQLLEETFSTTRFQPISKYQASYIDISMFVEDLSITAESLCSLLAKVHVLVSCVKLVDLFEKNLSRSLTFRLHLQSKDRSIEKEDLEEVISVATKTLMIPGIKLRL